MTRPHILAVNQPQGADHSPSLACILGACVICVDLLIRYIPGKAAFRIQDSSAFLACSLSLSFGVMVSIPPFPASCLHMVVMFC